MFLFKQSPTDKDSNDNSTLLAVKFKTTERTLYARPLSDYIASSYAEPPEAYRDDLRVLDELREAATAALDVNASVLKRNIRYYGQLSFILSKFPADVNVKFTWYNAFDSESAATCQDLYFEKAAVLFNIGAIYSQLACRESRNDKDSLNRAFGYFQSAAGIFAHLQYKVVSESRTQLTTDLSAYMLTTLENLMLCQAQECVWHRSVLGHMKDANVARVAEQVAEFYDLAIESGSQGSLAETIPSGWLDHFKAKRLYFYAEAQYRKALDCLASTQYGEEVARLQMAQDYCNQLNELIAYDQRWSRNLRAAVLDMAKSQQELVSSNCTRSVRDNDVIYLDPVPAASSLASISPYKLAQSKAPDIIENPGKYLGEEELGPPLFKGLVPFVIHQAASLYEDKKDQLVNKDLITSLDELTADCESVLNSLNLPNAIDAIQKPVGLPPNILVGADEIRSEGGYLGIKRLLDNAAAANAKAVSLLDASENALNEEAREDQRVRQGANPESARARRPESSDLTNSLRGEIAKYRDIVRKARESDVTIKNQVDTWSKFFALLGSPREEIEHQVPSTTVNPLTDPHHSQIVERLQQYLNEVMLMKRERLKSVENLKRIANEDDITPALNEEMQRLAASSSTPILQFELHQFEDLFSQRLDKYASWRKYIEEEKEAQAELLDSIREANQAFLMARSSHPLLQQRQKALSNLETAIKRYRESSFNLHDGTRFYSSLEAELQKLKDNCLDFTMARHLDALDLIGASHGEIPDDISQTPGHPTRMHPNSQQQQQQTNLVWDPTMPLKYANPK
ncbi:pH-response regulator protein palA/rim20 [Coemansia spiralis]|uniref:PH-response regulator protein palA/rim20 n=2 Tax=Coemansia TaxID=4863 RepID=A0A9W8KYE1_9FUNG|nr:BRO1-like domain-containing protein [Coemansia spiralis]KAJ1993010.1 pH-response regulator protein palA/rim20 [Coemansia umbellata]KAJ2622890.1 pH-response regulator protein palA/rim20 [Coemansia sp. RSA 1358]KAJ2678195.1 pH-response regulator protein palA/rim20 [Coemansia spiralis]